MSTKNPVVINALRASGKKVVCNASKTDSVGKWLAKEYPEEREMMDGFKMGITFDKLVKEMATGKDFYRILDCNESTQREYVMRELSSMYRVPYDVFYDMWLYHGAQDPRWVKKYGNYMKKLGI